MERYAISIRFYMNDRKGRGDRFPIYMRIIVDRKKSELAMNYFVKRSEWDEKKCRTKKNVQINEHLSELELQVYDIAKRLEKNSRPVTSESIKNIITRRDALDITLLAFYEGYILRLETAGELQKQSISRYKDTLEHLKEYVTKKLRMDDLLVEKIDFKFLSDFDLFLLSKIANTSGKTLERNTVNKHHARLRTILIRAVREGYIHKNPYLGFQLKNTPSKRTFLTHDELERLKNCDLAGNGSLIKVRDLFIFSVYTGLRFNDAQALTVDRIIVEQDGEKKLFITQEKTSEPVYIPILRPAQAIIDRYDNEERKITGKLLPKISNQKINSYLKIIAEMAGIEKNLTHHVARHTCATTVLLSNKVPIEAVSKWLGHTDIKTTQIYAKITNQYLSKIGKQLDEQIT